MYNINLAKVLRLLNEKIDFENGNQIISDEIRNKIIAEIKKAELLIYLCSLIKECQTVSDLNNALDLIYDCVDREKVWCGLL